MNIDLLESIDSFVAHNPRNKLVIVTSSLKEISFINLNEILSQRLSSIYGTSKFSLKSKDILSDILSNGTNHNDRFQQFIAISGIGILLEKELQFDFIAFLDQHSQTQTLFLKWHGEIIDNKLYFLTKQNGIEIDISDLSHIII